MLDKLLTKVYLLGFISLQEIFLQVAINISAQILGELDRGIGGNTLPTQWSHLASSGFKEASKASA